MTEMLVDRRGGRPAPAAPPQRSLRWAVLIDAQLHEPDSCPLPVRIVDLSASGCRLWVGYRLIPARPARLMIPDLRPVRATILWAREWYAGLGFTEPLHPAVVRHLIDRHQPVALCVPRVASMTAPSTP